MPHRYSTIIAKAFESKVCDMSARTAATMTRQRATPRATQPKPQIHSLPITVQDKPPMNFGDEHSAHCLRYGQAPMGRRSGASGRPSAPAPKRAEGCCHRRRSRTSPIANTPNIRLAPLRPTPIAAQATRPNPKPNSPPNQREAHRRKPIHPSVQSSKIVAKQRPLLR